MRRESLLESVAKMPWPVGVGFAVAVFLLFQIFRWFYPLDSLNPALASLLPVLAYGFCALLLFAAFLSLLTQIIRSRKYRSTRSLADVRSLTWREFETFVAELFREQGYFVMETPEGPDNGVDLVLRKDGEKTYVQCKHWKANSVGVEKVRELLGAMAAGGAQNGIFVASGRYTSAARELAKQVGIRLIDCDSLGVFLADFSKARDEFGRQSQATESECPVCGAPMIERMAKRGANIGQSFLGCTRYPDCRGTRSL